MVGALPGRPAVLGEETYPDRALDTRHETLADPIAGTMTVSDVNRFGAEYGTEYGMGEMPYSRALRIIQLLGTQVAPLVRQEPADRTTQETS